MYITVYQQKPMINFIRKKKKHWINKKPPNLKRSENSIKMHEFMHEIMKIKTKGRVERSYQPCERKNLQKLGWKWQKIFSGALPRRRERGKFEKVVWISQNTVFKKLDSWCSIDEKQVRSIEPGRGSLIFFKKDFDWSKIRLNQSKIWKKTSF